MFSASGGRKPSEVRILRGIQILHFGFRPSEGLRPPLAEKITRTPREDEHSQNEARPRSGRSDCSGRNGCSGQNLRRQKTSVKIAKIPPEFGTLWPRRAFNNYCKFAMRLPKRG